MRRSAILQYCFEPENTRAIDSRRAELLSSLGWYAFALPNRFGDFVELFATLSAFDHYDVFSAKLNRCKPFACFVHPHSRARCRRLLQFVALQCALDRKSTRLNS